MKIEDQCLSICSGCIVPACCSWREWLTCAVGLIGISDQVDYSRISTLNN